MVKMACARAWTAHQTGCLVCAWVWHAPGMADLTWYNHCGDTTHPQVVVRAPVWGQINLWLALAAPSSGRRGAHVGLCNRDEVHGFMNLSLCTVCVEARDFAPLCPWKTLHSCCCACGSHQCLWQATDCVTSTWSRCCIAPRCVGILQKHTVVCCSRQHCPAPCLPPMCTNTMRPAAAEAHTAFVAPPR